MADNHFLWKKSCSFPRWYFLSTSAGSEINFFQQAPTGDRNFFCSLEKLWSPKSVGKQKPNLLVATASKIFAINVIRYQTSAEIIFWPPFDAQRICKSSSNFFADVLSPPWNKLWKDFRTSLHTTSPVNTYGEKTNGASSARNTCATGSRWKNMAAKLRIVHSCKTLW